MDWFYTYYSVLAFSLSFFSLCWVFAILIQFACVPHYWVSFCILTTVYLKGHAYSHKKNAKKQYIHLICEALQMVKRQRIVVCVWVLLCSFFCVHRHSHRHYRYVTVAVDVAVIVVIFIDSDRGCDHEFDRKVFFFRSVHTKRTNSAHTHIPHILETKQWNFVVLMKHYSPFSLAMLISAFD